MVIVASLSVCSVFGGDIKLLYSNYMNSAKANNENEEWSPACMFYKKALMINCKTTLPGLISTNVCSV